MYERNKLYLKQRKYRTWKYTYSMQFNTSRDNPITRADY